MATANYYDSQNENYQVLTNFYAQFQLLPEKLNFRTSYSYDYSAIRGREYIAPYYVSSWQQQAVSELTKKDTNYYNYIWDNILTYNNQWENITLEPCWVTLCGNNSTDICGEKLIMYRKEKTNGFI